jgi:hypothetical protein
MWMMNNLVRDEFDEGYEIDEGPRLADTASKGTVTSFKAKKECSRSSTTASSGLWWTGYVALEGGMDDSWWML